MKHIFTKLCTRTARLSLVITVLLIGGGNSAWAQKSLPYSYGFENNDLATEGWTTSNLQSGSYKSQLYSSSYAAHTGNYCFRFYSNDNPPQYLFSPLLADSENGVIVSLYYKNSTANNKESFCVGYATVSSSPSASDFTWDTEVNCNSSSYSLYEHTFPAHARYIAIKSTTTTESSNIGTNWYLQIDDIAIEEDNPYKTPTAFIIDSYDATSATFSWTAGNNETTWQFDYSTDPNFTPGTGINGTSVSITSNPYTLSGLTTGTTYYASIRAVYGSGNYSEWTDKVEFTPVNEIIMTLFDGTAYSYNLPISSSNVANNTDLTQTQFIVPKEYLSSMTNRQITTLKFYASRASVTWGSATWEVYLKETDNTTYNSSTKTFESWGTCVYNNAGLSTDSNGEMTILLNTPFNYTGNNLMVGFKQKAKGTSPSSTYWYSINSSEATNRGIYHYGNYNGVISYLPKMTITSTPITTDPVQMGANGYTTFASPRALDLGNLPSGLKAYKAKVDEANSKVSFTEINQAVSANTGILLAGTAGETYSIPVADNGTTVTDNDFLVNSTGGTFAAESGYTYYGLIKDSDPLTFGSFEPASVAIPTNKAYLKVQDSATSRLMCVFFDATGISETTTAAAKSAANTTVFDLQGRRVAQPTKGLYIVNGKKVAFK